MSISPRSAADTKEFWEKSAEKSAEGSDARGTGDPGSGFSIASFKESMYRKDEAGEERCKDDDDDKAGAGARADDKDEATADNRAAASETP